MRGEDTVDVAFDESPLPAGVGDVDLNAMAGVMDDDTLYGAGFGIEIIRGLSITGDFESGEFSSWNIGFRLDLDED